MTDGTIPRWRERVRRLVHGRRLRRPIGLALGGGATLGAAHVGALRALEEAGVPVDVVSGTSIGAVAAALYAFAVPIDDIEAVALDMNWLSISSFAPSRLGLLANRRLGDVLRAEIGEPDFADARIPLTMIATDVSHGRRVVLDAGPVIPAVMGSTCVPGIFQPVEHDGALLIDGGLVENVPTSVLRPMGARTVIAIDLNAAREFQEPDDVIDVILNATDIAINNATHLQTRRGVDLHVAPRLSSHSRFRSGRGAQLVRDGYEATRRALRGWRPVRRPAGRDGPSGRQ